MDVVFAHSAGLELHKKTVMVCRVTPDPPGQQADGLMEVKEFGTLTRDLLAWSDWLSEAGATHVAMESTGEYWKPVSNLLEGTCTVFLVNAARMKNVPGRKTDRADALWLANLMRYGLLQASAIPPAEQRDLRDLTRNRATLVVSAFHMLSRHEPYQALGATDVDEHQRDHLIDRLTRRIACLGYRVTLEPVATV
jgi:transposase